MTSSLTRRTCLGAALSMPFIRRAHAEVSEVSIAKQFGTLYIQQDIMQQQKLIEKYGAALGLPGLRGAFPRFSGGAAMSDALLSRELHFGSSGAPVGWALWDKTQGDIKAAFAMNATKMRLLTVNPAVKSMKDITPADRIGLPTVGFSSQAVFLQMASAQAWGPGEWGRLNKQTIARSHVDNMAALLGDTETTCHFSTSPFQERAMASPKVHEVTNSYAIMGLPKCTPVTVFASKTFREENPIAWMATMAAFQEATDWINENPADAAQLYLTNSGDKDTPANVLANLKAEGNEITLQPTGAMVVANFMADTGVLKRRPGRIEDLFFPELLETGAN